jgi:hypothetical protein
MIEEIGLIDSAAEYCNDRELTSRQTAGNLTWIIASAVTVGVEPEGLFHKQDGFRRSPTL